MLEDMKYLKRKDHYNYEKDRYEILYRFRNKNSNFISFIKLIIGGFIMAYVALYIGYWVMIANLL